MTFPWRECITGYAIALADGGWKMSDVGVKK